MRTKDRLAELKNLAEENVYNDTVEIYIKDPNDDLPEDIKKIFEEAEKIRGWIHEIDGNTQLIRRLHSDPTYHTNKHLQELLDAAVTRSHAAGLKACGALRQFEGLPAAAEGAGARIGRLQYAAARRLLADALARHHALLEAVRDQRHAILRDHVKLMNLAVSEEECEALLESADIQLFVDNVRAQSQAARAALREAEARHAELLRAEGSLREVRELFLQMALLVADQQELIDTVEYYATQTTARVQSGGQELLKGTVSKKKARKKKMSLIICLVSGFLIVLIVLILT